MKALITLIYTIFLFNVLNSQFITSPYIPNYGIDMDFDQIDDTVSIPNSPPWDFSALNTSSTYSMSMMPISNSQFASEYPNASHVLISPNGEFYFGIDSLRATNYGRRTTGGTVTNYSNPLVMFEFPFDETINHSHTINSTVLWNNFNAPMNDNIQINGISKGTLTMPDGTIHNEAVLVDAIRTINNGPLFGQYLNIQEISKQFWVTGYPYPVIEILHAYSNSSLALKRSLFLQGTPAFNEQNFSEEITIYPNPTKNSITINSKKPGSVFETEIFDITGKLLQINNCNIIDMSNFNKGIYILKVRDGNNVNDWKVIKE